MADLNIYDKNKIGQLISWGGDHTVFDYANNQVIKFSLFNVLLGAHGREKIERDYSLSKQFFGKYVLETEFQTSVNGKYFAEIQPKVIGRYLCPEDLRDPVILNQFREIMQAYHGLLAAGYDQIDLVGRGGILRKRMSNIFVTPAKQLVIIDATLLEFNGASMLLMPLFVILRWAAKWRNNQVIKTFQHVRT